jgi:hypothetical protein
MEPPTQLKITCTLTEATRFHEQVGLVKGTEAEYDYFTRAWYLTLANHELTPRILELLARAAQEYGTAVHVLPSGD